MSQGRNEVKQRTLNVSEDAHIFRGHKVDGHALAAESSTTTNSVNVVFSVAWQVVVDN